MRCVDVSRMVFTCLKLFGRWRVNLGREAAMNITRCIAIIFATAIFLMASQAPARAQEQAEPQQTKEPGPDDMPGMEMNEMQHDAGSHPDAAQSAHEAKVGYLVQMRVHLVDDSRLIAAIESSVGMISTVKSNAYSKETFPYSTPRVNSKCASSDPGG